MHTKLFSTKILVVTMLFLFSSAIGCSQTNSEIISVMTDEKPDSKFDITQQYLFGIVYTNFAWTAQRQTLSVLVDGSVYLTPNIKPTITDLAIENKQYYTAQQLAEFFEPEKSLVSNINLDKLTEKNHLLEKINPQELSESTSKCFDAGSATFWGFIYDLNNKTYQAILLSQRGDWVQINQGEQARQLNDWLVKVAQSTEQGKKFFLLDMCQ